MNQAMHIISPIGGNKLMWPSVCWCSFKMPKFVFVKNVIHVWKLGTLLEGVHR